MVLIRSRFGDDIDHAASVFTILRAQHSGFHAKLRDCVGEGKRQVPVAHVVLIIAAIETPQSCVAIAAGNGDGDGLVGVFAAGKVVAGSCNGATGDGKQAGDLAAGGIERHLGDVLLVNRLLERGILSLQGEAFGVNFNLHVLLSDGQHSVDGDAAADFKDDVGLFVGLEALSDGIDDIRADGETWKEIGSSITALGDVFHLCGCVGGGDDCIGDDGTGSIGDGALNVSGSSDLGSSLSGQQKHGHRENHGSPGLGEPTVSAVCVCH